MSPETVGREDPKTTCDGCGKPEGSFACKIRHLQLNTGFAKAYEDFK